MPIKVTCSNCGKAYALKDEQAGKKVRCAACQGIFFATPLKDTPAESSADREEGCVQESSRPAKARRLKESRRKNKGARSKIVIAFIAITIVVIICEVIILSLGGNEKSTDKTPEKNTTSQRLAKVAVSAENQNESIMSEEISDEQVSAAKTAGVKPIIEIDLGSGVTMTMVFIPPGKFMMGSSQNEIDKLNEVYEKAPDVKKGSNVFAMEGPQHEVTIKTGFYISTTETTEAQWKAIMKTEPQYSCGDNRPITMVTWNEAKTFIKKMNATGNGMYRLPSEAEWEYSCRAGTTTRFSFGDNMADLNNYGWWLKNSGEEGHDVGQKIPNDWGLYDMHGNVCEWCEDDWHGTYDGAPDDGSAWIDTPRSKSRVVRGGSFAATSFWWSSSRFSFYPSLGNLDRGFRLVKDVSD